ncbi:hypothetical protein OE88DRAFT_1803408 [Heliocybe sulcata]|uniref:F-box domain-containing protein n=1 Tax=Heliocybe sulcata TaxID=5364 RepID=A0A5C3NJU2_9AGAM|nr:hypothetical protein OE88DRAFT_1803408 [Heliocybe sulcata]
MAEGSRRRSTRLQSLTEARTQETAKQQVHPAELLTSKRRKTNVIPSGTTLLNRSDDASSKNRKRKRGKLWRLPEMPLDILFEILELLHPSDLLRLSRTSKSLRACLLNPTAVTVWKRARGNVEGLPDCPPNLTEPRYAHLLFEHTCNFCGTSGITDVLWECWVRSCYKCIEKNFIGEEEVDLELPLNKDYALLRYIWDPRPKHYDRLYLKAEVVELSKKLSATKSKEIRALYDIVQETVDANNTETKYVNACSLWYSQVRHQRAVELNRLRKERMRGIQDRMEALGWGEEFDKMIWSTKREYMRHASVNQAKSMTDRIWRNIEASMIQLFTKFKAERLRRERVEVLCKRLNILKRLVRDEVLALPPLTPLPDVADLLEIPAFKKIIFRPSEQDVNHASFDLQMLRFQHHVTTWKDQVRETLRALLPDPVIPGETPEQSDKLFNLATSFLRCPWCVRPVPFPQIVMHKCMRQYVRFTNDDLEEKCFQHLRMEPWLRWGEKLVFDTVASKAAEAIVLATGEDVKTTSHSDMVNLEGFYVCPHCSDDETYVAMSWRRAIYHAATNHRQPDLEPLPWTLLPDAYEAEMQEEQDGQRHDIIEQMYLMCCMRCREERMSPQELVTHFVVKHSDILDEIREDSRCFYVHPDVDDRCTPREARLKIRQDDKAEEGTPPAEDSSSSSSASAWSTFNSSAGPSSEGASQQMDPDEVGDDVQATAQTEDPSLSDSALEWNTPSSAARLSTDGSSEAEQ